MTSLASRRDKALALGPVLVAHGVAAWLLVTNSPESTARSGTSDPVISIELFDARTDAPAPTVATMATTAAAPSDPRLLAQPIRPATVADVVDPLTASSEPQFQSAAPQPQTASTLSSGRAFANTTDGNTASSRVSPSTSSPSSPAGGTPAPTATDRYPAQVLAWIERNKRYPPRASDRRLEGEAVVALTLDRRGRLRGVELIQSSGHPLLDEAAIDAVQRADPFPRPETGNWTRRRFEVPLRFRPARP